MIFANVLREFPDVFLFTSSKFPGQSSCARAASSDAAQLRWCHSKPKTINPKPSGKAVFRHCGSKSPSRQNCKAVPCSASCTLMEIPPYVQDERVMQLSRQRPADIAQKSCWIDT